MGAIAPTGQIFFLKKIIFYNGLQLEKKKLYYSLLLELKKKKKQVLKKTSI